MKRLPHRALLFSVSQIPFPISLSYQRSQLVGIHTVCRVRVRVDINAAQLCRMSSASKKTNNYHCIWARKRESVQEALAVAVYGPKEDNRGSFRWFNRRGKAIGCKQSTYEGAVLHLVCGDVVVVHTGGFWIDALEVARTAGIVRVVIHGACAGAAAGPTKSKRTGREDEGC